MSPAPCSRADALGRLTKAEQFARYQASKDDPSFWADAVAKHGREGAYQMWKHMSQKEAEYGTETTTGEPTSEAETPGG